MERRVHCFDCGKIISTEVPPDFLLRGTATCPECEEKETHLDEVIELLSDFYEKSKLEQKRSGSYQEGFLDGIDKSIALLETKKKV